MRSRIHIGTLGIGEFTQQDGKVEEGVEDGDGRDEDHCALERTKLQQAGASRENESAVEAAKERSEAEGGEGNEGGGGQKEGGFTRPDCGIHALCVL